MKYRKISQPMFGKIVSLTLVLLCAPWLLAQENATPAPQPGAPSITFALDWPVQDPARYSINVKETGTATYNEPASGNPNDQPFTIEWTLSPTLRTQLFDLAKQANYFKGKSESKAKVADTGKKTLTYKDAAHNTGLSYNYVGDKSIQELTRIFQGIALSVHLGNLLQRDLRYDHLGLNQHLKTLQEQQQLGQALEVQAIRPILEKIASDRAAMNIAQQRASQILKGAGINDQE